MQRVFLFCYVLGACLVACGGTAELAGETLPEDSGTDAIADVAAEQDAAVLDTGLDASNEDSPADAPPDGSPSEFCSGAAKAKWGTTTVEMPVITTSMLFMDCCEGALLRLHTRSSLGFDYALTVVSAWPMTPGDYALTTDPSLPEVSVAVLGNPAQEIPATGTLHVAEPVSHEMRFGLCVETPAGEVPGGSRLYVPEAFVAPYDWEGRFSVHLLADATLTATQALKLPLESLQLDQVPILNLMSIGWYGASTHSVHWDAWGSSALLSHLSNVPVQGLPFVVVADGQRIYLGAFMTMISSYAIDAPTIMKEEVTQEGFEIKAPLKAPDPRSDPRLIKVLQESWKLGP